MSCISRPIKGSFQFGSPLSVTKVLSFWDIEFTGNEPDYISQDNNSNNNVIFFGNFPEVNKRPPVRAVRNGSVET